MLARRLLTAGTGGGVTLPSDFAGFINVKTAGNPYQIHYVESSDAGESFTMNATPTFAVGAGGTWYDTHIVHPRLIQEGSTLAVYVSGHDGTTWRTGRWTSSTLSPTAGDWTADPANPIIDLGASGQPDDVGAHIPYCEYDSANDLTRIWYTGFDGTTYRTCYAERASNGTITKYGAVLNPGGVGDFDEQYASGGPMLTINGEKRLYYGGTNAAGDSSVGYATYTDPRVAATYTKQGVLISGPFTSSDGNYDSIGMVDIVRRGTQYLFFGTYIHPTGSANLREISLRATSTDGLTFSNFLAPIVPMTTAYPAEESRENPDVMAA